jgi:hypothetical protein
MRSRLAHSFYNRGENKERVASLKKECQNDMTLEIQNCHLLPNEPEDTEKMIEN